MLNSNLKKNRKMFQQRYESTLQSLHAPYVSVTLPILPEDQSPGSLESLASRGDSWAVLCTGGSSSHICVLKRTDLHQTNRLQALRVLGSCIQTAIVSYDGRLCDSNFGAACGS